MFDELAPDEQDSRTRDQLARPVSLAPADAGAFKNFLPGTFSYINKSLAEVGRAASMAGAVVPIVADKLIGDDNKGKTLTEGYFEAHDRIFQDAIDYWTPKPNEVGAAGQIVGQLSGGLLQFLASQAVAVMTAQMNTGIDLVRAGVDADTALVAGDFAGLGMAAGVAIPVLGRTLAGKMATGAVGNVAQSAAVEGATHAVLTGRGFDEQAKAHDPWDVRGRALDALLGAAFGGAIHVQERFALREREALSTLNQSRYIESTTMQGAPTNQADVSQHVAAIKTATDQLLRGEPVNVDAPRTVPDDAKTAARAEVQREMVNQAGELGKPIPEPEMNGDWPSLRELTRSNRAAAELVKEIDAAGGSPEVFAREAKRLRDAAEARASEGMRDLSEQYNTMAQMLDDTAAMRKERITDPIAAEAQAALRMFPDMQVGLQDADGVESRMSASDYLAKVAAESQRADADANVFTVAAECLLGAL